MELTLVGEQVRTTIQKNTAISYGLTLVVGLPFPPGISDQIQCVQKQLEALAPGQFAWYGLEHLHATLVAPLRGRYREWPPLRREELPVDLQGFVLNLSDFFARLDPFPLELGGVRIAEDGCVLIAESAPVQYVISCPQWYPELDQPKHGKGLYVAIGFLKVPQPFSSDEEREHFKEAFAQVAKIQIGRMIVQQVWLVHYANRTLNRIIGKVPFTLRYPNALLVGHLLQGLGISEST